MECVKWVGRDGWLGWLGFGVGIVGEVFTGCACGGSGGGERVCERERARVTYNG